MLLLLQHLVSRQESFDGFNSDGDKLRPANSAIGIFIGQSQQSANVVLLQIIGGQILKCVVKLGIVQLFVVIVVCLGEELDQSAFQCLNEARRLDIDFLRTLHFFVEVEGFHDVEFWHKRVDWVILFVHKSGVFKFGSQVQLLLDLVLVFQYSVDPTLKNTKNASVIGFEKIRLNFKIQMKKRGKTVTYLEHIRTHGGVQTVLEGLIFEVELNFVVIRRVPNQNVEENLDSAFWDWLVLRGLRELHIVSENQKIERISFNLYEKRREGGVKILTREYFRVPVQRKLG